VTSNHLHLADLFVARAGHAAATHSAAAAETSTEASAAASSARRAFPLVALRDHGEVAIQDPGAGNIGLRRRGWLRRRCVKQKYGRFGRRSDRQGEQRCCDSHVIRPWAGAGIDNSV
jgi:hypothetical protein